MQGKTHRYGGLALGAVASLATVGSIKGIDTVFFMGAFLTGSTLGSLIPDLDHRHSELSKKVKPLGVLVSSVCKHRGFTHTGLCCFLVTLVCFLLDVIVANIKIGTYDWGTSFIVGVVFTGIIMSVFVGLVKFTHIKKLNRIRFNKEKMLMLTIVVLGLTTLFADILVNYIGYYIIGISVGYVSHLLVDMLTVSGVPLMYPYTNKMYRLATLTTGEDDKWVSKILFIVFIVFTLIRLFI